MSPRRLGPAVLLALLCAAPLAGADPVDTTPPAAPAIIVDTPLFSFTGEAGGSFACRVDGGAWVACVAPWDSGVTSVGDHTFEVRQTDDAGNVGDAASFSWTVAPADDSGTAELLDPTLPLDSSAPLPQATSPCAAGCTARRSAAAT